MNAVAKVEEVIKPKTKMEIARDLFKQVNTRGFALDGKTQRGKFIELAEKAGLSKYCAGTYYQNLSNDSRGQPLYKYNKAKKAPTKDEIKEAEAQVLSNIGKHRWMALDADGKEVDSFESRTKAQDAAKVLKGKWADRTKAA